MITLRALPSSPAEAPPVAVDAARFDLPSGPFVVVRHPLGAAPAELHNLADRVSAALGVPVVVMPETWRLEVVEAVEGPRSCPSCGARMGVDGCELCAPVAVGRVT